jgi:hypothetical protein
VTAVPKLTVEDYLAMEAEATEKHEFYGGEVVAMSGARPAHNVVTTRLTLAVGNALGSRPCLTFSSDQRVRVDETGAYCYPDLSVVCGRPDFAGPAPDSLLNPDRDLRGALADDRVLGTGAASSATSSMSPRSRSTRSSIRRCDASSGTPARPTGAVSGSTGASTPEAWR